MARAYARLTAALAVLLAIALPGYYNKRDQFSHFVKPPSAAGKPCPHACCRGLRAHPEGYPVAKRNKYLRNSSDKELFGYYGRHQDDSPADERTRDQVLAEMQRRDIAQERREATEERRRQRWAARRLERAAEVERVWLAAENATKGNMLSRRGKEAGVSERSLFVGPESRVRKYGSEELLNFFEYTPRPTAAYFEGRESRMGYAAGLSPRRRMTSEEEAWRRRYEEIEWEIEQGIAA